MVALPPPMRCGVRSITVPRGVGGTAPDACVGVLSGRGGKKGAVAAGYIADFWGKIKNRSSLNDR